MAETGFEVLKHFHWKNTSSDDGKSMTKATLSHGFMYQMWLIIKQLKQTVSTGPVQTSVAFMTVSEYTHR